MGPADGSLGRNTVSGIIRFQAENRLTSDGTAGFNTLTAINEALAKRGVTLASTTTVSAIQPITTASTITLVLPRASSDIRAAKGQTSACNLQKTLRDAGHNPGPVDCSPGILTLIALNQFRTQNKLSTASGYILDLATQSKLEEVASSTTVAAKTTATQPILNVFASDFRILKGFFPNEVLLSGITIANITDNFTDLGYGNAPITKISFKNETTLNSSLGMKLYVLSDDGPIDPILGTYSNDQVTFQIPNLIGSGSNQQDVKISNGESLGFVLTIPQSNIPSGTGFKMLVSDVRARYYNQGWKAMRCSQIINTITSPNSRFCVDPLPSSPPVL